MMMTVVVVFINNIPQIAKQKHQHPGRVQVPEMGNVFVKNIQQQVRE